MKNKKIAIAVIAAIVISGMIACGPQDPYTHRSETETMNSDDPGKPGSVTNDTTGTAQGATSSSYRPDKTASDDPGPGH